MAQGEGIVVQMFQDEAYVWLCYPVPEDSYGTLDLVVDAPGLDEPVNLHVSAQLGEWRAGHRDEAPQGADSDAWWRVEGWWSNAVFWNGTRETDDGPRPNSALPKVAKCSWPNRALARGPGSCISRSAACGRPTGACPNCLCRPMTTNGLS